METIKIIKYKNNRKFYAKTGPHKGKYISTKNLLGYILDKRDFIVTCSEAGTDLTLDVVIKALHMASKATEDKVSLLTHLRTLIRYISLIEAPQEKPKAA